VKGFPDSLILGMEIRDKVANYVGEKINSIRNNSAGKMCENTAIVRSNAMKAFTNYFEKDSVSPLLWRLTDSFRLRKYSSVLRTLTLRNQTIADELSTLRF
jgi:tRNA (guanine-N7-)-methyltransferase